MALDFLSTVLTSYRADVSDHVAGLKKLKGEEAARAKETIEHNEKIKGSLEEQIKSIGKVSVAIASIAGAFMAARAAMNSYAEHTKLSAAASGVSIEALASATKGLKTEHELLTDAARLNNGAFKLTTEQMVIAEQAMIQFTRRGHDNAKAHDAVLQAVTALKVDGLKDLGVFVDMTGLSMEKEADRGKILGRVFGELTKASADFANSNLTDTEKIEANANRITNAIDKLKVNVGKGIGAGMGAVEWLSTGFMRQVTGGAPENIDNMFGPRPSDIYTDVASRGSEAGRYWKQKYAEAAVKPEIEMPAEVMTRQRGGGAAAAAMTAAQALAQFANASVGDTGIGLSLGGATTLGGMNTLGSAAGYGGVQTSDLTAANSNALTANWKDKIGGYEKSRKTFMESTFGPVGQFDAYKQAFDGFTGAVTAGYGAMVDGTMSFGKAFKQAVAGALKATGAQMLIESLKEAAYGAANLAVGNAPGAAAHFKSSALFAAGSIAAGVVANQLGGGGAGGAAGGAGAGAGAGAPAAPRAADASPQSSVVYVVGDPFDTEANPRRRQNNAKRLLDEVGMRSSMGGSY